MTAATRKQLPTAAWLAVIVIGTLVWCGLLFHVAVFCLIHYAKWQGWLAG